ncbi:TonB family protein [Leeia sp. TBRC 13508]|uniref:TonB family protein n=1 Tax=Leeia speluncae TaxID=2884804 RepID=A0ABS8D5F5_9NEIS|nr:TonB family protein [Leeia speluncae]MCB6183425.1 TonB family protein [Leeia speluncae]
MASVSDKKSTRFSPALMVEFAPPRKPRTWPLWSALALSLVLHAGVIKTHFVDPMLDAFSKVPRKLEVVLVNAKHKKPPVDAQALAQANLDGGGNTDADRMAKSPLPAMDNDLKGDDYEQLQKKQQALAAEAQELIRQIHQQKTSKTQVDVEKLKPQEVGVPTDVGDAELQKQLDIARLEAQLTKEYEAYQKKPRRKYITARTRESSSALYYSVWKNKVEHVGELNYPKGLYGSLKLVVTIRKDGSLDDVEVIKSSGNKKLDVAAAKVVMLAGPFQAPGAAVLGEDNRLSIISTFTFTNTGKLNSTLENE